jgi:hypothetical protein
MSNVANAYTIGRTSSYERAFEEVNGLALEKCVGGWVWPTTSEARTFMERNKGRDFGFLLEPSAFSVYGLILPNGWDKDVSEQPDESGAHVLLKDVPLVRLGHSFDEF